MNLKEKMLSAASIAEFERHLISEEKSVLTIGKYIRDVKAFIEFAGGSGVTKETVIAYKKHLQENYAARSVNSMLASMQLLSELKPAIQQTSHFTALWLLWRSALLRL